MLTLSLELSNEGARTLEVELRRFLAYERGKLAASRPDPEERAGTASVVGERLLTTLQQEIRDQETRWAAQDLAREEEKNIRAFRRGS
jgi:hypothetical protein